MEPGRRSTNDHLIPPLRRRISQCMQAACRSSAPIADPPADALGVLLRAAQAGGAAAHRFFRPGGTTSARITYKGNNSPVTEADLAADAAIRAVIAAEMPDATVFSEEAAGDDSRFRHARVIVVDPIDGTRAFIQGRSEWCVSLALMVEGRIEAGVIHVPARGETFAAAAGRGATLNNRPLARRQPKAGALRVSGPNRLVDTLTEHWPDLEDGETLRALAYRLVTVAGGAHDVAVATLGAHDWDIAAADIILQETGCSLLTLKGAKPVYNATNPVHPPLIAADANTADRLVARLTGAEL